MGKRSGVAFRHFDKYFPHCIQIGSVGDADRYPKTHFLVAVTPIDNRVRGEHRVWHNQCYIIVGDDGGTPGANVDDLPGYLIDFDPVADLDRALSKDDKSTDKVARNVLQTETNAYPHGSGEHSQRRQVNPGILQC
jgi:hypothetical protein